MNTEIKEYVFQGNLDIDSVEQIHKELKELVKNHSIITFDLNSVFLITTPGAQLLLSLVKHAKSQNKKVIMKNFQPQAKENLAELGIKIEMFE